LHIELHSERKTTRRLSITLEGRDRAMMSGPLVNGNIQTTTPFQFHLLFYYMAEAPSSTFNPRRLLQLQSSSPLHPSSTLILLANFITRHRELQPSSPFNF
jgi:hypothetical protein